MNRDHETGELIFICDLCGSTYNAETADAIVARQQIEEMGWTLVLQRQTDFQHVCPGHTQDEIDRLS